MLSFISYKTEIQFSQMLWRIFSENCKQAHNSNASNVHSRPSHTASNASNIYIYNT